MDSGAGPSDAAGPPNATDSSDVQYDDHRGASRRAPSSSRQFGAVLRKNYLLQTRSRKLWWGGAGWLALLVEILVPVAFFGLMCIPKHYIKPQPLPRQIISRAYDLDMGLTSKPGSADYLGPARFTQDAKLLFAPNSSDAMSVMQWFAQAAACPADPNKKTAMSTSFYRYFASQDAPLNCQDPEACMANASCWQRLFGSHLFGFGTEAEAVSYAVKFPRTVDAVVAFHNLQRENISYAIRVNHTSVPSSRELLNYFSPAPDAQYQLYWFFANVQQLLERALLGVAAGSSGPADITSTFKPFPWPAVQIDLGAGAAALAFNLLLVYAFLAPTRATVAAIVREKELRLREGMRILGLKDAAYWASWFISHWTTMAVSGALCAIVGTYPFAHSSATVLLAFYWLVAAALISYAYALSTLFSRSRIAGTSAAFIYAVSMIPGWLMPYLVPYGGISWTLACLLPPSSISLFASILLKMEVAQQGLTWGALGESITPDFPFTGRGVMLVLAADILIYALLTAYLEHVVPSEVGQQQLPPWFFLLPSFWRERRAHSIDRKLLAHLLSSSTHNKGVAVAISDLRKTYASADGTAKQAVDGLDLDIYTGNITGLLGHNGAGKTTTISILTGMIAPTSGDAVINGMSIRNQMGIIRQNLGVCPQFDILWPNITVAEHLELYAAIKGYSRADMGAVVHDAVADVGLLDKLDSLAGELSGGQRRKLSVAIAFLGGPGVVILDEPTSGMDPYSRRLTWEIIKRHRNQRAIVLTTHSMEEADVLCDRIAILADGRLAAVGSSLDLKTQYGVGYTLTIVKELPPPSEVVLPSLNRPASPGSSLAALEAASEAEAEVDELLRRHVPEAELVSRAGREIAYRMPKDAASKFPMMLRELEANKAALHVRSYGVSVTTMEEVFLHVSRHAAAQAAEAQKQAAADAAAADGQATNGIGVASGAAPPDAPMPDDHDELPPVEADPAFEHTRELLSGPRLYAQRLRALFTKRAACARRDRLAVVTQLAVPIALVLVALWAGKAYVDAPNEPPLAIDMDSCFRGNPTAFAASPQARSASPAGLQLLRRNYHDPPGLEKAAHHKQVISSYDTNQTKLFTAPFFANASGTLEGYLLDSWFSGNNTYDALFIESLPNASEVDDHLRAGPVAYTVLLNQTAIHGLPAALNAVNTALLRAFSGNANATMRLVNHPLPTMSNEETVKVNQMSGDLLMVLCVTMAAAVLAASFSVFLVREAESRSKHVQVVSGAPLTAFWGATYLWDLLNFTIPVAGIILCFYAFDLPQFRGVRMAAVVVLFLCFGAASLPLTYLLSFCFSDEMRSLQVLNTAFFLTGYLGFLSTWIMDTIATFIRNPTLTWYDSTTKHLLRAFSPHFVLARGLYDISQTYKEDQGLPNLNPFTWSVSGNMYTWLAVQAAGYILLTLVTDAGLFPGIAYRARRSLRRLRIRFGRPSDYAPLPAGEADAEAGGVMPNEDEDVAAERRLVQSGAATADSHQVLLDDVRKVYSNGRGRPPTVAVAGVSLAVGRGECFGLLGLNGAGKTTTFRILTGEERADEGEAFICGRSVRRELRLAHQLTGYCPQFEGLPGQMTGREVLRMYARLRGEPPRHIEHLVSQLLHRLGLTEFADRTSESYSGGNRRKLAVAVALMAGPPLVLMDEPSTGMDPAARHFLWGILQRQVIAEGHTVVLTSHSMEECEALCDRIAIMTGGRLACLGTPQHLKNRFGAGYLLDMRVAAEAREAVTQLVRSLSPDAVVTQKGGDHLSFSLPQAQLDLPSIFQKVEETREALGIEEYSLSQTTLEQVFVTLAKREAEAAEEAAAVHS